ncbi:MAG TPA: nuclear transport factor 2 family protein [Rhizomicrobium sp.]|jgi:PhnB protein|nr:nuclear transport factor 2 family protein [Rhizomicrobium sp.]
MNNSLQDEAEIRSILDDGAKALYAKDADAMVAHYAEDIVVANLAPPLRNEGFEGRNRAVIEQWFDSWIGPIDLEIRDLHVEVSGDLAFAYGLSHMSGTKRNGDRPDLWTRVTHCFRREDGKWKIVHLHDSVPFYMDGSFRAATDLKP